MQVGSDITLIIVVSVIFVYKIVGMHSSNWSKMSAKS